MRTFAASSSRFQTSFQSRQIKRAASFLKGKVENWPRRSQNTVRVAPDLSSPQSRSVFRIQQGEKKNLDHPPKIQRKQRKLEKTSWKHHTNRRLIQFWLSQLLIFIFMYINNSNSLVFLCSLYTILKYSIFYINKKCFLSWIFEMTCFFFTENKTSFEFSFMVRANFAELKLLNEYTIKR